MSRRKGTRKAPKPVKEAYVEALHRRNKRARSPVPDSTEPITMARRWGAVGAATVMLLFSFAGIVTAIVERDNGNSASARGAVITSIVIAPIALYALGFFSRAATPLRTAVFVAPAAMTGFALIAALLREPATAVVTAFGIAGAFALRLDEGKHSAPRRLTVVGILAVLTMVAYAFAPDVTIIVAPLLPFAASALADLTTERRVSTG